MTPITPLELLERHEKVTSYSGPAMLLVRRIPMGNTSYRSPASYWWGPEMVRANGAYCNYRRSGVIQYCRPDSRRRYR